MSHNTVFSIEILVQFPNDAVRADRIAVILEIGHPGGPPFILRSFDSVFRARRAALFANQAFDGINHQIKRNLGIADEADITNRVFVDLIHVID